MHKLAFIKIVKASFNDELARIPASKNTNAKVLDNQPINIYDKEGKAAVPELTPPEMASIQSQNA